MVSGEPTPLQHGTCWLDRQAFAWVGVPPLCSSRSFLKTVLAILDATGGAESKGLTRATGMWAGLPCGQTPHYLPDPRGPAAVCSRQSRSLLSPAGGRQGHLRRSPPPSSSHASCCEHRRWRSDGGPRPSGRSCCGRHPWTWGAGWEACCPFTVLDTFVLMSGQAPGSGRTGCGLLTPCRHALLGVPQGS